MKKHLLIVSCTPKSSSDNTILSKTVWLYKHNRRGQQVDVEFVTNNKKGLSEQYNKFLNDKEVVDTYHTVLFVHDDVELEDIRMVDKLIDSPYDVTGLAGAKTFDKNAVKLAWHLASSKQDYVGEVAHCYQDRIWTTVFGPTKSRSLTLDGLFLAVKPNILKQKGLTFDENFQFHFYDIAFCLRANERKVSCGVLPIRVIHHGIGDSMLTSEWQNANSLFREKYCL